MKRKKILSMAAVVLFILFFSAYQNVINKKEEVEFRTAEAGTKDTTIEIVKSDWGWWSKEKQEVETARELWEEEKKENEKIREAKRQLEKINFTVEKPHMELTEEEDTLYKDAYLKILKDEIIAYKPSYFGGFPYYIRDFLVKGEFRDFLYDDSHFYYDDLDGDGLPELGIRKDGSFIIVKWEEGWDVFALSDWYGSAHEEKILESGKLWHHDRHEWPVKDELYGYDGAGMWRCIWRIESEKVDCSDEYHFSLWINGMDESIELNEKEGKDLLEPLFKQTEADEPFILKSFEEIFGERLYKQEEISMLEPGSETQGGMRIDDAARHVFEFLWSDEDFDSLCTVYETEGALDTRYGTTGYPAYEFELPETDSAIEGYCTALQREGVDGVRYQIDHDRRTEDGRYDIFGVTEWNYIENGEEREYHIYPPEFFGYFAVDRKTGEVIWQRKFQEESENWYCNGNFEEIWVRYFVKENEKKSNDNYEEVLENGEK